MTLPRETFEFQAETKHLLDLMIHSLYTAKDIFLRELISNASDALDRLRFELLVRPELTGDDAPLEIFVEVDEQARTLTVGDNGIGMTRDEVIANIGTVAKSGTRELREKLRAGAGEEKLTELIGQFGVGFYSAFMVADKVTLVTRAAGEDAATLWESDGGGEYALSETTRPARGTSVTLHLKAPDAESGRGGPAPLRARRARHGELCRASAPLPSIRQGARLLLGHALLAEGSELHDPVRFNSLVVELMAQTL